AYEAVWTKLDISQKARLPFLIINALCVVLLVILAIMVGLWPNIPNYMREDVCVEKECMESSSQILLSANITEDVCRNPYAWACGKFEDEYLNRIEPHNFLGEWNTKSSADYEEISRIHAFITQMPIAGNTYSAQSILKGLYSACMTSETSAKYQDDFELKQTIFSLRGWEYGENWHANSWDLDEALTTIQSKYGVFPFFKISVENRNSAPFGNIVKISEGEYGLPHKMFYNLSPNHKIISAYQLLLRDFAINFGVVSEMAKKFASHVFHFEQRIVNSLPEVRESGIFTLAKVQKMAPSLPITETITATFPKLNDRTLILVEDVKLLKELSTIVSTTDETPLNNFITWSISRHFLPFMSREYRAALEEFHSKIYGFETAQPTWYFCSRLLRNWMPFAIDSLRQNPQLIVAATPVTYTSICKCISIENIGTEVDDKNVDTLNAVRMEFSMPSSAKILGNARMENHNLLLIKIPNAINKSQLSNEIKIKLKF
ncbi:Protein gone early, partial [Pseudolycoriella hygida]